MSPGPDTKKRGNRPLRVLLVAPSLDIVGGQAVQAHRLLTRLREEADLQVGFVPHNPRLPGPFRALQRIKFVRTVVTELYYILLLLVTVGRYDVLHIFSASYFSFLLAPTPAILIGRLFGKKVLLNYRSGEAQDHLTKWRATAVPTLKLAHRIVVQSGFLVEVFQRFGLEAETVPAIIETERFRFRERVPLRPVFLSNRNLEPLYNIGCVLRAFAHIQQQIAEARLTVVGDGSERGAMERLAEELRLQNVSFLGRVRPDEMPGLLDDADILLNSPNIDNAPGSLVEAFAAGVAVVTSDAGGIPYIVTDRVTGMMVPCDAPDKLAEAALRLLAEPGLARRVTENARQECDTYKWSFVRQRWLGHYRGLAEAEDTDRLHRKDLTAPQ